MCGLTGIIFGKKERSDRELKFLKDLFTSMFVFSEERGHHASGLVTLNVDGNTSIYKVPVCPSKLVFTDGYNRVLSTLDNRTTVILGHSRWKTVGSEFNNNNNQPLITGKILGTHNGTIINANDLFDKFKFRRKAQVDSEVLFRMADSSLSNGVLNTNTYRQYLSLCQGHLSFVLASKEDPEHVFIFKGDKPLSLFYNKELRVIVYASIDRYILDSLVNKDGWYEVMIDDNNLLSTSFTEFETLVSEPFSYIKGFVVKKNKTTKTKQLQKELFK